MALLREVPLVGDVNWVALAECGCVEATLDRFWSLALWFRFRV